MSRHPCLPSQLKGLRGLFGQEVEVVKDGRPFDSAEEIAARYREGGYDDIVVVAPLSVIKQLLDLSIKPLWADMEEVPSPEAEVVARGRGFRFARFRRIVGLSLEFEDVPRFYV
jgi:hypothetical protein